MKNRLAPTVTGTGDAKPASRSSASTRTRVAASGTITSRIAVAGIAPGTKITACRGTTDIADVHAAIRAAVHGPAPIPAAPDHVPVSAALATVLTHAAQLAWHEGETEVRLAQLVRALLPKPSPR